MDEDQQTKHSLFYTIKQRVFKGRLPTTSCFKSRVPKHKIKSESSHCHFVSSPSESQLNGSCDMLTRPRIANSVSEPAFADCIESTTQVLSNNPAEELPPGNDEFHSVSGEIADCVSTQHALNCARTLRSPSPLTFQNVNYMSPFPDIKCKGLLGEITKLYKHGWYWGSMSKEEAEEKLANQSDGAFLLRDSSSPYYILSVSFKSTGKTLHTRIKYDLCRGVFYFYRHPEEGFNTIAELVDHSIWISKSAVYCYSRPASPGHAAFPVRLSKPVSRFTCVRSLQHLCRFVIRQSIRRDNINNLPLPKKVKDYVAEEYFF